MCVCVCVVCLVSVPWHFGWSLVTASFAFRICVYMTDIILGDVGIYSPLSSDEESNLVASWL